MFSSHFSFDLNTLILSILSGLQRILSGRSELNDIWELSTLFTIMRGDHQFHRMCVIGLKTFLNVPNVKSIQLQYGSELKIDSQCKKIITPRSDKD